MWCIKRNGKIMIGSSVTKMVCKAVRGMCIAFAKNSYVALPSFVQ